MSYLPNTERSINPYSSWYSATQKVNFDNFKIISAAAYLGKYAEEDSVVYENSQCDMLFIMSPKEAGWKIRIKAFTPDAITLKAYILKVIYSLADNTDNTIEVE